MSLHSSSSVNGEGSTPKDPLYKILDELRSLNQGLEVLTNQGLGLVDQLGFKGI